MRALWTLLALAFAGAPVLAEAETRDEAVDWYFAETDSKAKPWKIEGGLGLTFKDGNTDLFNFAGRALLEKRWIEHLLRFTAQSIYSEENDIETASEHILVERYEYYLSEKHRIWQQLWLETDSQESLSLRFVLTGGYGYRFVKTDTFVLWGEVGAGWESETFYGGADKDEAILQFNVEWTWQITKTLKYEQHIQIWPSLSEGGEYKIIWDSKFTMPISDRWSFALIIQDKYDSDPEPGNEENDLTVIFTLTFDFTKKEAKE